MADFAAYVFYVNRPDLLIRSLESFRHIWGNLTVLDNSPSGNAVDQISELGSDPSIGAMVGLVSSLNYVPPVPLAYAQGMNWMLKDALIKGVDFILHFHSDSYSKNPNAVQELLSYARKVRDGGKKWACLYTFYDILWCLNVDALRNMGGWDTNFPTYFGDNDFRRRAFLEGYECIDTGIQGIGHEGSATINSDGKLQFLNSRVFPLHEELYREKHGGPPGKERFLHPYGQEWLSWKP